VTIVAMRFSPEAHMSKANGVLVYRRNEYGYPVLESRHGDAGRSVVQAMLAHKATGAIIGLMFALGATGWLWTFVLSH
jgi:hypothetical protein